ncbi:MAG: hypothetical protein GY898_02980 [Proteobacteria bacterium]|nr:hypothetical protein [Pseudomonadota bacterium]
MYVLAAVPCVLIGRSMLFPDDAYTPIVDALEILRGGGILANHNPRFGYGRGLSYVPLAAAADSLMSFAVLRSLLAAAIVPMVFAAARLFGATRIGAVIGAGLLLLSRDLMQNLASGHEAYLAIEWSAAAVLGMALVVADPDRGWWTPSSWAGAVLLGVGIPMAAMNHPLASALFVVAPFLALSQVRAKAVPAAIFGYALALALILPHLGVIERASFTTLARPEGMDPRGLGEWWMIIGSRPGLDAVLLLAAPLLLFVLGGRRTRWVGAVGLGMIGLLIAISAQASVVHPWYWRSAIPLAAVCLALAARGRAAVPIGVAVALALGLSAAWWADPGEEKLWTMARAEVVDRTAARLEADGGRFGLAGYGYPTGRRVPELLPLALDASLAGTKDRFSTDVAAMEGLPTVVHIEGVAAPELAAGTLPAGVEVLGSGPRGATFLARDAAAARELGAVFCGMAGEPVRYDDLRDALGLLLDGVTVTEGRPPGVHACAATQD